jgi:hypothetical protein
MSPIEAKEAQERRIYQTEINHITEVKQLHQKSIERHKARIAELEKQEFDLRLAYDGKHHIVKEMDTFETYTEAISERR